ncbi:MAG TPA: hypothetical protein VNW04_12270 [Puia sp.]|jgi:uncharacterized membrane protein|nr:hypothetical protein [Puia sp.]
MKHRKILLLTLAFSGVVVYLAGCSKQSEDKLAGNTTCDTVNVSYALQVIPILQNNCYSCHSSATPPTGIRLDTYANLKVFASNGFLSAAVEHTGTVTPMPYGLPKLPDCEVNTIAAWVDQGALNN